jgi:hypothetical protein
MRDSERSNLYFNHEMVFFFLNNKTLLKYKQPLYTRSILEVQ